MQKQGITWDAVPQPRLKVTDFSKPAFDYFKLKAADTKRIAPELLKDNPALLLEKLRLKKNAYFKRAAVLLFHPDPEKYITGAYVKIGFFNTDDDLVFQDEIHGYLLTR